MKLKPKAATMLRKHSRDLTVDIAAEIMESTATKKKSTVVNLKVSADLCNRYMDGMKPEQMITLIEQALDAWFAGGKGGCQCLMRMIWLVWIQTTSISSMKMCMM